MKWAAAAFGGVFAFLLVMILGVAIGGQSASACGGGAGQVNIAGIPVTASTGSWDSEQLVNAAHIMNAASAMKLSTRAQQIGVMTAIGESTLRNLNYGDNALNPDGSIADSIGLFQQQSFWGSTPDRMDPEKSATLFFQRLVNVAGWETIDPSLAAHKVQINGDITLPDGTLVLADNYYTQFWQDALTITEYLAHNFSATGATACTSGEAAFPLDQPYDMTDDFGPRIAPTEGASSWHAGIDLDAECGDPIYAVLPGRVVRSDRLTLGIQSPDGFTVLYLHSHLSERLVNVGDQVQRGQHIAGVGNEAPSNGCHLHLGIDVTGNHNDKVATLPQSPEVPGFVDPEAFMKLFGVDVCPEQWCARRY